MKTEKFAHKKPTYNSDIAFVHKDDPSRWILGWMDMHSVRVEGEATYNLDELTFWMYMPKTPNESLI